MRPLFLLTILANLAFAVASIGLLPNPAATHFDINGVADGFGPPLENAMMMIGVIVFLAAIFLGTTALMAVLPGYCFSLPNRDYWLGEEHRPETMRKIREFMDEIGVGTMAFFLLLQWETLQANRFDPPRLPPTAMTLGTGILTAFLVIVTIRILWTFRLPKPV